MGEAGSDHVHRREDGNKHWGDGMHGNRNSWLSTRGCRTQKKDLDRGTRSGRRFDTTCNTSGWVLIISFPGIANRKSQIEQLMIGQQALLRRRIFDFRPNL